MADQSPQAPGFIRGDRFAGLCIAGEDDRLDAFELEGSAVAVRCAWTRPGTAFLRLDLTFQVSRPVRFRVDVQVPEKCLNACALMNNLPLIGWFSDCFPENSPQLPVSACAEHEKAVSTLRPGRFQSVSFRWQNQDQLSFYFVMPAGQDLP